MGSRARQILAAFKDRPVLWVGVLLTAFIAILAYKQYKKNQAANSSIAQTNNPSTGLPGGLSPAVPSDAQQSSGYNLNPLVPNIPIPATLPPASTWGGENPGGGPGTWMVGSHFVPGQGWVQDPGWLSSLIDGTHSGPSAGVVATSQPDPSAPVGNQAYLMPPSFPVFSGVDSGATPPAAAQAPAPSKVAAAVGNMPAGQAIAAAISKARQTVASAPKVVPVFGRTPSAPRSTYMAPVVGVTSAGRTISTYTVPSHMHVQ